MYRGCARIDKFGDSEVFKSILLVRDPCLMRYYSVWMGCSVPKYIKCRELAIMRKRKDNSNTCTCFRIDFPDATHQASILVNIRE
jgi:hypothetical protein